MAEDNDKEKEKEKAAEEKLRQELKKAAAQIKPRGGLGNIRRRIKAKSDGKPKKGKKK
jgi:hypothetical protein